MQIQENKKCEKKECIDLLAELADLKEQLKSAEDQLEIVKAQENTADLNSNASLTTAIESFDMAKTADVISSAKENAAPTISSAKHVFLQSISNLIHDSSIDQIDSGALLLCEFSNISSGKNEHTERAIAQNEARMIDSLVNACTKQGNLIAYISHFERAIFIPNDPEGAIAGMVCDKLIRATKSYKPPKQLHGLSYKCSIGISIYPNDTTDIDSLFRYADRATYASLKIKDSYYSYYL